MSILHANIWENCRQNFTNSTQKAWVIWQKFVIFQDSIMAAEWCSWILAKGLFFVFLKICPCGLKLSRQIGITCLLHFEVYFHVLDNFYVNCQNNRNYNSNKFSYKFAFIPVLSFRSNKKLESNFQQVGDLVARNISVFCL